MKFEVNPAMLHKELSLCKKVMGGKPALPILENYLFELEGDSLTVTASDTENTIRTRVVVKGDGGSGRVCVDGARILGLLSTLRDESVSFSEDGGGTVCVNSVNGSYSVQCFNPDEYPLPTQIDGGVSFKVGSSTLSALLGGVSYAMSRDALRAVLTGAFLEISEGRLTAVSTDANVLASGSVGLDGAVDGVSCIVPSKTVNLISGLSSEGDVEVRVCDKNIMFSMDRTEVIARLIDGKYPNYKAVVPNGSPLNVVLDRAALIESLKRMMLFASESVCVAVFSFGQDGLRIHVDGADLKGSASDSVACQLGRDFEIGFNAHKMLSVLNNIVSDKVQFGFSEPNRAAVVVPSGDNPLNTLGLCMPCIIQC